MAADIEQAAAEVIESVLVQRGRYGLFELSDGSGAIRRATPICERCQTCGCGEQSPPMFVPKGVVGYLTGQMSIPELLQSLMSGIPLPKAMLGKLVGNGNRG